MKTTAIIKNKKKAEILAESISKLNYGDIISHKDISKIIKEPYGCNKYRTIINQTKKILQQQYQRHIESINKCGYRVVDPDKTVDLSIRHYNRGFNEVQKAQDVLTNAPVEDMSNEGRQVYRDVYDRAKILNTAFMDATVEIKRLSRKRKHPMSVENINMH